MGVRALAGERGGGPDMEKVASIQAWLADNF